jgi:hypothetical protein
MPDLETVLRALVFVALVGVCLYLVQRRSRKIEEATRQGGLHRIAGASGAGQAVPPDVQKLLSAMNAGYEDGRLLPPRNVHDRRAWDEYWKNHLECGTIKQAFSDWMTSDRTLVGLLIQRGARTILCAGNGLSSEALTLALHGFDVVALDISLVAAAAMRARMSGPEYPAHRIPGLAEREDGSWSFGPPGPIDPALCPPMHRSADCPNRGGGSLAIVAGDLMDPGVYPGPFDAVIERRTAQLFPEAERDVVLERLTARLADRGTILSHQHCGAWTFGQPRVHFAEAWLAGHGFSVVCDAFESPRGAAERLACLVFTTG